MKKTFFWLLTAFLLFALSQAAMAADAKGKGEDSGKPAGVIITDSMQAKATVTDIDHKKRTVTLTGPEGNKLTLKADKSMKNFDQIKKGDVVVATYYDSMVISVQKPGEAPAVSEAEVVKVAPKGQKPAAVAVNTVKAEATVQAVDVKKRTVSLMMPDGTTKKIKVGKDVKNLDKLQKGDRIVVRMTEAVAVNVMKP